MEKEINKSSHETQSEEDEIDLLELIGIMWVHKWWIAGITGLAAVAVILYVVVFSSTLIADKESIKTYTSTAIVLVNEASGVGIPFSMYEGRFDISSLLNSTSLLVSYGTLAENLLNEASMYNELVKKYNTSTAGNLDAIYDKVSGLLRISCTSDNPEKAKELAEGAYKLVQARFKSFITDFAMEERKILENKLEETRKEFLTLEYNLSQFSDEKLTKNLSKEEFELYTNMKLERDICRDLMDYLPRLILFVSIKDKIETPIFQLVEMPTVSAANVSGRSGKMLISVVIMAAFFLSVMLVFILNAVKNIKNNPERMKKLKGIK